MNGTISNFIIKHSEFSHISGNGNYIFNHVSAQTELDFKKALSKKLGYFVDGIENNSSKFMDEILTDQLFFTTETAVTKTDIGSTYTNLFTDYGGRPFFIDTTGFTKLAIQILWTKVGTGVQTLRIVDNADDTQILESSSLTTQSNDFTNVNIPQNYLNFKGKWRLQCKSTVAGDDPIFSGLRLYLRR